MQETQLLFQSMSMANITVFLKLKDLGYAKLSKLIFESANLFKLPKLAQNFLKLCPCQKVENSSFSILPFSLIFKEKKILYIVALKKLSEIVKFRCGRVLPETRCSFSTAEN